MTAAMKLKDTCSLEGFPCGSAGKESACNERDLSSIPGLGRSPGEGKGYSGLKNSMYCIVHGVAKSWTWLSNFHFAPWKKSNDKPREYIKKQRHHFAEKKVHLVWDFTFTFHFYALEKEMATHSSVLAWRIPETGEPGGLLSMGSHRVRHDWSNLEAAAVKNIYVFQ